MEKLIIEKPSAKKATSSNSGAFFDTLSQTPASKLAETFNASQQDSVSALKSEKDKTIKKVPKVNENEGSAYKDVSKAKKNAAANKKLGKKGGANKTTKGPIKTFGKEEMKFPEKPLLKKTFFNFQTVGAAKIESQAQSQLDAVQFDTEEIPTKMNEKASVDLSGEADVNTVSQDHDAQLHEINLQKTEASKDVYKDYGENNIIKKPGNKKLQTNHKPSATKVKITTIKDFKPEGIDPALLDAQFGSEIQSKIGAESSKYQTAQDEHDQKVIDEENNADTKIEAEKEKSKDAQNKSVKTAQGDVTKSRSEWETELNNTETEFAKNSGDAAKESLKEINTQKTEGEKTAQGHIDKANDDAKDEKKKSEKEAEEKKAEKKKESKGFFGWLADKASALINALKDALNFIFKKLREAVKAIFDLAKKLIVAALEFARKAIVGLIKAFGAVLKKFVDVALAAFPKLRDRIKSKIDNFVDKAEKFVNKAFDLFKKAITAILDFLASAIDALLGALQAFYNFILDVVNFIVAGILKILEGLANLVSSAIEMPGHFMGQISEEFLGMDVTKPLPFEKSGPAAAAAENVPSDSELGDLLQKQSYEEDDFHVDPVADNFELSPELMSKLSVGDGEYHFGENENTMEGFKQEFANPTTEESTEAPPASPTEKSDIPDDPYAQADWFIDYQNKQAPMDTSASNSDGKEAATAESMPEEMKMVGPWSPAVRLYYLKEQMWAGIKKKWEENKVTYIGIGVAIVLVITALAIATGGAIFGLIPPALEIFAAIMMAAAMVKASGFFKDYMVDGWAGKIVNAGKALARAIGIILVELIFILLFDSAALFKVLKTAAKSGAKGVFTMAKAGVKSTLKAGKNALVASGKGLVKQAGKAKFLIQGIGKGMSKGVKSLDELGESLAKRFKFKGFKIVVKGFRFYLYGSINPWVLLANGDLVEVTNKGGVKVGEAGKFKSVAGGKDIDGILVGIGSGSTKSKFVRSLEDGTTNVDDFLKIADDTARKEVIHGVDSFNYDQVLRDFGKKVADTIKNRGSISKNAIKELAGEFDQAHHLIPVELIQKSDILRKAIDGGFEFNGKINSKWLKQFSSRVDDLKDGIHASHPNYTKNVLKKMSSDFDYYLKNVVKKGSINEVTEAQVKAFMDNFAKQIDTILEDNLKLANPKKIDDLIF